MKRLCYLVPAAAVIALLTMGQSIDYTAYFHDTITRTNAMVAGTNFVKELAVTNGATLGGVRRTAWPVSGSTNLTDSGTNVLAQGGVKADNLTATNGITGVALYPFVKPTRAICEGDSLTQVGYATSLAALIPSNLTTLSNVAVSGETIVQMLAEYATEVQPLKPAGGTNAVLFIWGGTIDLDAAVAGTTIWGNLSNYWTQAKADGFTVVAFTMTKCYTMATGPKIDQERAVLNGLIRRSSALWDYLIDVEEAIPSNYGTTSDECHFTAEYNSYIAALAANRISQQKGLAHRTVVPSTPQVWQAYDGSLQTTVNSTNIVYIDATTGKILMNQDGVYDFGTSTTNRVKSFYAAQYLSAGYGLQLAAGADVSFSGRDSIFPTSSGVLTLYDNTSTSFNRLQLGGTTSLYPSIKRNGAGLDVRLADDSAYTDLAASTLTLTNNSISNVVAQINSLAGTTNDLFKVTSGGTNKFRVDYAGYVTTPEINAPAGNNITVRAPAGQSLDLYALNTAKASWNGAYFNLTTSSGGFSINGDCYILRDTSNTLAQYNTTNPQQFSIYDTRTDTSNFRNATIGWSKNANALTICTTNAGTALGTGGSIILAPLGTTALTVQTNGGVNAATSISTPFVSCGGSGMLLNSGAPVYWNSASGIRNVSNGILRVHNYNEDSFTRFVFGAVNTNCPALSTYTNDPGRPYIAVTDGTGASTRPILQKRFVDTRATNYALVDLSSFKVFTNEGATGMVTNSLPAAVVGLQYTFVVQDGDGMTVQAVGDDTIRVAATVTGAAGNASCTTIGNTLTLLAINATEWVALSHEGTWTLSAP